MEHFVVSHFIDINEDDPKKNVFRFAMSTKNMMEKAKHSNIIAVDNTYQLVFEGNWNFFY